MRVTLLENERAVPNPAAATLSRVMRKVFPDEVIVVGVLWLVALLKLDIPSALLQSWYL